MQLIVKKFDELTVTELYDILKLRAAVFILEQNCLYQDLDEKDKHAYHVYLTDNNNIQAYARVLDIGVSYADATSIGRIISAERGKGLGSQIVKASIQVAKDKYGPNKIKIAAQSYAKVFYEKEGFVVCSDEFLEDGIPHVEMVLG